MNTPSALRRSLLLGFAGALVAALVSLPVPAVAVGSTVVTFGDLAVGTTLANQYASQGVLFGPSVELGLGRLAVDCYGQAPKVVSYGLIGRAASVPVCGGPSEFPYYGVAVAFTSFHRAVSIRSVGEGATLGLTAYDVHGAVVSTTTQVSGRTTSVTAASPVIAYIGIRGGSGAAFDDLTFDHVDDPPLPQIAVGIVGGSYIPLRQGGTVSVELRILRFNGSVGPVALSLTGLPELAGTLWDPGSGTGSTARVRLTASTYQHVGQFDGTVVATPSASAGSDSATAPLTLRVVEPFTLSGALPRTLAACASSSATWSLATTGDFDDPLRLSVSYSHPDPAVKVSVPATFTPGFDHGVPVVVTAPAGHGPATEHVTVRAASADGRYASVVEADVARTAGTITSVTMNGHAVDVVGAPMLGKHGSGVGVLGSGFCPGSTVTFGASAPTPLSVSSNGVGSVSVPADATDGPVRLQNGNGDTTSFVPLRVNTFRSDRALTFHNPSSTGGLVWNDMLAVFGSGNTTVQADPCGFLTLGLAECSVGSTGIPTPEAFSLWVAISGMNKSGNCYGMALASYRIAARLKALEDFSSTASNVGDLTISSDLQTYVRQMHMVQLSQEGLELALHSRARGYTGLRNDVQGALQAGRPAIVWLKSGDHGHAVLAYDVRTTANGYDLVTYNSNVQFTAAETTGVGEHAFRLEQSLLHVTSSGWTYAMGDDTWSGDFMAIGAYDVGRIPTGPLHLPQVATAGAVVFASGGDAFGAVRGASGAKLAGVRRVPLLGAGKGEVLVLPRGRTAQVSLARGHGTVTVIGSHGRSYSVSGPADSVRLAADGSTLAVSGVAGTVVQAGGSSGGTQRTARVILGGRTTLSLGLTAKGAVTMSSSRAAKVAVTVAGAGHAGAATRELGRVSLRAHDAATVPAGTWASSSHRATVTVRSAHGTRKVTVSSSTQGKIATSALRLAAKTSKNHAVSLTLRSTPKLANVTGARAVVGWELSRKGKVAAHGTVRLTAAQLSELSHGHAVTFKVNGKKAGTYRLRVALVVSGVTTKAATPAQGHATATKTVRLR